MSRLRSSARFLAVGLLIAAAAGAGYWWHHASRPDYRLRRGIQAAKEGDFLVTEQYIQLLDKAGAQDHARLLKGELAFRQNNFDGALEHARLIPAKSPLHVKAAVLGARCLVSMRRPRDAERVLQLVLDEEPDEVDAHRLLGQIYYDQGDYTRALPQMEITADLDPNDPLPHRNIGRMYRDMEDQDSAVAAYEESLRRNEVQLRKRRVPTLPDEPDVRVELATCLLKQFKDAEAIAALGNLDTPEAIAIRAEARIGLGQNAEAIAALDAGLEKYPEDGGLLRLRGERYNAVGMPKQAAELLERALTKDPQDYRGRRQLAQAYEALGRTKDQTEQSRLADATRKLIEEIDLKNREAMKNPWDPAPRQRLAELCAQMGRPEEAKRWEFAAKACLSAR